MQHTVDLRKKQENQIPSEKEKILIPHLLKKEGAELKSEKKENTEQSKYISWQALTKQNNSNKKYLIVVISILLLSAMGVYVFSQNTLMSILLVLSSVVMMLHAIKKPELKNVIIDTNGVRIGEDGFTYKELKSFWINYNPGFDKELSLESQRWYLPYVTISLENQNPIEIRSWLTDFLPEKEREKSIIDLLFKKIGL